MVSRAPLPPTPIPAKRAGRIKLFLKRYSMLWIPTLLITLLTAWAMYSNRDRTYEWTEDVQLADGSVIQIKRKELVEVKGGELFKKGYWMKEETVILPGKNGQKIVWRESTSPMVVLRGTPPIEWIVIGSTISCEQFKRYGSPRPAYTQFNYKNDKWTYHTVDPQFYGTISNLMVNEHRSNLETHIPVTDKDKFNRLSEGIDTRYLKVSQYMISSC